MSRILVVDDESDICEILQFNLETEGYTVATAHSAREAEEIIKRDGVFDLILLDVMMEGKSGFALARELKADTRTANIPIIFITAKTQENDTVTGLNIGGDDYIRKPFSVREVIARVKAVLRRYEHDQEDITIDGMHINVANKAVYIDDMAVNLTKTEYDLLLLLVERPRYVFSREEIFEKIWSGEVVVTERTIDVNVTRLRKKLGRYGAYIKTRQGFGYYFER